MALGLFLRLALCAALIASGSTAYAQPRSAPTIAAASSPSAPASMSPSPSPSPPAAGTSAQTPERQDILEKLSGDLSTTISRLSLLEAATRQSADLAGWAAWRSFWLAVLTIVASVAVQYGLVRHQRNMAREQAQNEVANSFVEWQLKQQSELYGPLRALLGQSIAMYRQMNNVLAKKRPDLFRLTPRTGGDYDNRVFEVLKDGQWTRFRTVRDVGDVYNKGYGVEPYFDDVVKVGGRMAKLMKEKAGYARPHDNELIRVMGVYLAHYAVLTRLHEQAKEGKTVEPSEADKDASFPYEMHDLVIKGYDATNTEVMAWRNRTNTTA